MTKDEALKLGLQLVATAEYLATDAEICGKDAKEERALIQRSKIAFEEALAQPKQEPAAWELRAGKTDRVLIEITNNPQRAHDWKASLEEVVPLYTTPPQRKPEQESDDLTIAYMAGFYDGKNKYAPQRTWVGLTEENRNDCLVSADPCECLAEFEAHQLMEDVEAKLREKNT